MAIFSLILIAFIIIWTQIESSRNEKRRGEEEAAMERKRQHSLTKISEAKSYLNSNRYRECLAKLDQLDFNQNSVEVLEMRAECFYSLGNHSDVIAIVGGKSIVLRSFRARSYFALGQFDKAADCISFLNSPFELEEKFMQETEVLVQLFYELFNPFKNWDLFWEHIDKSTKRYFVGVISHEFFDRVKNSHGGHKVVKRDVVQDDFLRLTNLEHLDIDCFKGDGSFFNPYNYKYGNHLSNLGFLLFFGNLKSLSLRGQDKLKSFYGIELIPELEYLNLSDMPVKDVIKIRKRLDKNQLVRIFTKDDEFSALRRKQDNDSYEVALNKATRVNNTKQHYPQFFFPLKFYLVDSHCLLKNLSPYYQVTGIDKGVLKGFSEDYFFGFLVAKFGDFVRRDISLSSNGFFQDYHPDFTYFDTDLLVDIEIDEPYTMSTKEVIHTHAINMQRNLIFMKSDWFVVRFSEKQIVNNPNDCIEVLDRFINTIKAGIKRGDILSGVFISELRTSVNIDEFVHASWSEADSKHMALNSFRESYLDKIR